MSIVQLAVDVNCDSSEPNSIYRVFVNNDLYTERTWIWPSYQIFIREHLVAELPAGQHQVRIEKVSGPGNFTVSRFSINGTPLVNTNDLTFWVS